jgi:hypothetical protein
MHGTPCIFICMHGAPCVYMKEREDVLSELEQKLNALGAQIEETWRGL